MKYGKLSETEIQLVVLTMWVDEWSGIEQTAAVWVDHFRETVLQLWNHLRKAANSLCPAHDMHLVLLFKGILLSVLISFSFYINFQT